LWLYVTAAALSVGIAIAVGSWLPGDGFDRGWIALGVGSLVIIPLSFGPVVVDRLRDWIAREVEQVIKRREPAADALVEQLAQARRELRRALFEYESLRNRFSLQRQRLVSLIRRTGLGRERIAKRAVGKKPSQVEPSRRREP